MRMDYVLWMAGSALVCAALLEWQGRVRLKRGGFGMLTLALGAPLCAVCSKALYCLTQLSFVLAEGWRESLLSASARTWCMTGGAAGVILAAALSARILRVRTMAALDAFAPVGALLAALARFGCIFLQEEQVGWGMYTDAAALAFFPATIGNEWGERYLAVFMLETLCALAVAAGAARLRRMRFVRALYYLCLTQILCESLHSDSICWLFVRVEQLAAMLVVEGTLILYAVKAAPGARRLVPPLVGVGCAGVFVAVEFALDKSSLSIVLLYAVMAVFMAVLAAAERRGFRRAYPA